MDYYIRLAELDDLPYLPLIEQHAATLFAEFPFGAILANIVTPIEVLQSALNDQRLWVAVTSHPIGFAIAEVIENAAYLAEIDVHPHYGRQGIGQALVKIVCQWAQTQGFTNITLTTFRHVPWNAPFYTRLGFQIISPVNYTPSIQALVQSEQARGLPIEQRVVMQLLLQI